MLNPPGKPYSDPGMHTAASLVDKGRLKDTQGPHLTLVSGKNHLEERLLDQAQVRASYTPPFLGVVRVAYPNVWFLTSNPL